ncbi:hypothetical protein MYCTH_2123265 [Thermothelomyces thermophilus ATCC 42464]|uniref:Uncharacterized protein n=1 Tax=Thermothelomyces thermophilus (strain ATCC 42464 / BCRC 31852 / DSM 1799) TaxID=573729 RepID=G2Q3C0_THET4|nr:uncharacterized protein MYCTH_2123265 [Thermothelomyces thermophilus ATCC 42464]AEO54381.1 hypothetical protein MYCTH_2123265 [Thermothelomyces thermophilus ATCC 42464]
MTDVLWLKDARHGGALLERFQPVRHFAHAWEQFFHDINGVMETDLEDSLEDLSEKLPEFDGNFAGSENTLSVVHPEEKLGEPTGSNGVTPSPGPLPNDEEGHLKTCISYCQEHGPTAQSLSDVDWYRSQIIQPQPQRKYTTAYEEEDSRPDIRGSENIRTSLADALKTPLAPRWDQQVQAAPFAPPPPQPTTQLTTPEDEERILEQLHIERETAALRRKEHISEVVRVTKAAAAATGGVPPAAAASGRDRRQAHVAPATAAPRRQMTVITTTMMRRRLPGPNVNCAVDDSGHLGVACEVRLARKRARIAEDPRKHGLPSCTWRKSKTRSAPKDGIPTVMLTEPEGESWYLVDSMCPVDEEAEGKVDGEDCSGDPNPRIKTFKIELSIILPALSNQLSTAYPE